MRRKIQKKVGVGAAQKSMLRRGGEKNKVKKYPGGEEDS